MKKYITPKTEISDIVLCEMVAASLNMGGTTEDENIVSMETKDGAWGDLW